MTENTDEFNNSSENPPTVHDGAGNKEWWFKGKLHRTDGPAVERANGDKLWCIHGKNHREGGPAVEDADGSKVWWINGKRHRDDGPAIEDADGHQEWWINGKQLSEKEFILKKEQELERKVKDEIKRGLPKPLTIKGLVNFD